VNLPIETGKWKTQLRSGVERFEFSEFGSWPTVSFRRRKVRGLLSIARRALIFLNVPKAERERAVERPPVVIIYAGHMRA
jgi:hypothetical protein